MSRSNRGGSRKQQIVGQWGYYDGAIELVYSLYRDGRVTLRKVTKRNSRVGNSTLMVTDEVTAEVPLEKPAWRWGQVPNEVKG